RRTAPIMLAISAFTIAGLMIPQPLLRLELLEIGAMLTGVLVWQTTRKQSARLTYIVVVLISAATAFAGELLSDSSQQAWPRALLLTSACVKLGAVPMFFWLLSLADELPALVLGLIIAVVDIAAFGEFCVGSMLTNSALSPQPLWIWAAALTALLSALLMLTQRSLKRLLVLSTIEDIGFLLLGLSSVQWIGIDGALIAAATHSL